MHRKNIVQQKFTLMTNQAKNLFLPAKTIFASPVFTADKTAVFHLPQKPANPGSHPKL